MFKIAQLSEKRRKDHKQNVVDEHFHISLS